MAWAVSAAQPHGPTETASPAAHARDVPAAADETPQTGILLYPSGNTSKESENPAAAPSAGSTTTPSDAEKSTEDANDASSAARGGSKDSGESAHRQSGSLPSSSASGHSTQTQRTKTIHHTAFKRVAVYKTVTHKAAVKSTKVVDGQTVTVWTLCPVCGQRHSTSYTQKVLDHYENVHCKACGKKHSTSYTETVRY